VSWFCRNCVVLVFSIFFSSAAQANFWQSFYGQQPDSAIDVGSFVLHFSGSSDYHYWYPMVGVTYHSVNVMYFNNSFEKPTLGLTMERNWLSRTLGNGFAFNLNYRAGALFGGYCITSLKCDKSPKIPVVPIFQVIAGVSYGEHAAFSLTWLAFVATASLQYRF
jgi:hypothetical protein